ncbi:hypothetical protein D3C78_1970640 [compost metagenome]
MLRALHVQVALVLDRHLVLRVREVDEGEEGAVVIEHGVVEFGLRQPMSHEE